MGDDPHTDMTTAAMLKRGVLIVGGVLVVGQVVRPNRANPPIDPAKTLEALAHPPANIAASLDRACRDCHSSETVWPWYTNVSPVSWWIANHVREGRREVNFSQWDRFDPRRRAKKLGDICEQVERGEMPMTSYVIVHREAQLSDAERQAICDWTKAERAKIGPLPALPDGERGEGRRRGRDGDRRD